MEILRMKLKDIRALTDLSPKKRAMQCLELGNAMQEIRASPKLKGKLPQAFARDVVLDSPVGSLINSLHGIKVSVPDDLKGLRDTGRSLRTKAGVMADMVLTPRARKTLLKSSLKERSRDESMVELAVRQLGLSMLDNDPMTRCCAAYAYWQATGMDVGAPILENALDSDNEDERMLAAQSLVKMDRRQAKRLQGTAQDDKPLTPPEPLQNSMTVIIHGTFAMNAAWYQPGGDFHEYIRSEVYPDVYSQDDFFFWSGRYSATEDGLRRIWRQAARKLVSWTNAHPATTLRLIAHSHGNNVVNMATQMGMQSCTLIQLSPPVRRDNLPEMANVSSDTLFNIHSTVDLVVTLDGGSKDYRGTSVASSERRRTISRFGHSDSHDSELWESKNIPALVKTVCP